MSSGKTGNDRDGETGDGMTGNTLYYGDNLEILRRYIADASVDLIYLDPPFNSNRNYNVLFREKSGEASPSQIQAFTDTWEWDRVTEAAYAEIIDTGPHNVATMIDAMRKFIGTNDMMAYLVMMAQRMVELHRVLKPTGSLYLHCDPTASHYLKMLLDTSFSAQNFRNEIVWKRADAHNDPRKYGNVHDILLFYSNGTTYTWNRLYSPYSDKYLASEWRPLPSGRYYKAENMLDPRSSMREYDFMGTVARWRTNYEGMLRLWNMSQTKVPDSHGRIKLGKDGKPIKRCRIIFLDEVPGVPLQTVWTDIKSLRGGAQERLGYPTQKPLKLLERIIESSSNPGDVVLDPFCGCGTAVVAAQTLGRQWIGIDITHLSIALMKNRLVDAFGETLKFQIKGEPEDVGSARMLAEDDRYEFQRWANSLVNAQPIEGRDKKGADRGIDGVIRFVDDAQGKLKRVLVQVKSGHVSSATMRDLIGTMNREQAEMAMLITLEAPTKPMIQEAVEAGTYFSPGWNREFPSVQIVTIEELLSGGKPDVPPMRATFERAQRIRQASTHAQASLLDG